MKSNHLRVDLEELRTGFATMNNGKKIPIVYHSDLEKIINNTTIIKYEYPQIIVDNNGRAAVVCRMTTNDESRVVSAVGESCCATLPSDVAKNYSITMAANRAFDRAAIRWLNLAVDGYGQVYSDLEIAPDGPCKHDLEELKDAEPDNLPTPPPEEVAEEKKDEITEPKRSSNTVQEEHPHPVTETPTQKKTKETNNGIDDGGSQIISMGKYRNLGKTVADVFAENPNWLAHVAYNIVSNDPSITAQINCARRYLEAHAV